MEVDNNGNLYVIGATKSTDFPIINSAGAYNQGTNAGLYDLFVAKFDVNSTLLWSTYLGGSRNDPATNTEDIGSCLNANQHLFITASSLSTDFPINNPGGGAYVDNTKAGTNYDAIIAEFDVNNALPWSTYFGGTARDQGYEILNDLNGNTYATGYTRSTDLTTVDLGGGAYYQANNPGGNADAYILKFDPNRQLIWSSYLGGNGIEYGKAIAVDGDNNVYFGGESISTDFPLLDPGGSAWYQGVKQGTSSDAFISGFTENGIMFWSTYFGGTTLNDNLNRDWVESAVVDINGCLVFAGEWWSDIGLATPVFPGGNAYYQPNISDPDDGMILKFCPDVLKPIATLSATKTNCYGDSTGSVSAVPSGGTPGYTYDWQPGNYTDSLVTGLPAGTYTLTLTDANNNTYVDSIEVTQPDQLLLDPIQDIDACNGDTINLTANASGGTLPYTYQWNNNTNGDSFTHIASTDTSFYVVVRDSAGCKDSINFDVTIVPAIVAQVNPDTIVCLGDSVQLIASGGSTYSWLPSTSLNDASSSSPYASPSSKTTYTVIVSSGNCTVDTAYVEVDVEEVNALSSGNVTICVGDSVQLVASGGTTYQWIPANDIDDANSANPTVWPTNTTTYSVVVGNGKCQPDTAEVLVTVVPSITAGINQDTLICEGDSVTLTASGGSTYSWTPASSLSDSTGTSVIATPTTTTLYEVTVTSGSCAPATNQVTIYVDPAPTVTVSGDTLIEEGNSAELTATGGNTYQWSPTDDVDDSTAASVIVTPSVTTTYTIQITDLNGCTSTTTITVQIKEECEGGEEELIYIPSAFSPNGDGVNDVFQVRFDENCVEVIRFIVFDRWGEKVFEANTNQSWDGTHRNAILNSAAFDYYLEALLYDGETIIKSGSVSLVR